MRHKARIVGCGMLFIAVLLGGGNFLQGQAAGSKGILLKLLLPVPEPGYSFFKEAKVFVDGIEAVKVQGQADDVRTIIATPGKGKDFVLVTVVWDTNNYTTITRPRKIMAKEGEIAVDFRKGSDTEKDDIVVRFVATPDDVVDAMCKMARIGKDDVVYDLGCGDGRMVIAGVKKFGAKRGVGVELNPKLVEQCKAAAQDAGVADKVEFRVGDVLKVEDMSDATVVLLYMGEDINKRLKPILQKTLKPGSRVVSHRFLMGDDWKPLRTETIKSNGYPYDIHLWEIKAK